MLNHQTVSPDTGPKQSLTVLRRATAVQNLHCIIFSCLTGITCFFAGITPGHADTQTLDTVKVTGHTEPGIPLSAYFLDLEQQNYQDDLAGVLNHQAGIQTQRAGGIGAYSSLWLRGSPAKQLRIYLDNFDLNDPLNGGVNLAQVPLQLLESATVYPDYQPMHLGNSGLGGAIILNTPQQRSGTQLQAETGSFGYAALHAGYYAPDLTLMAGAQQADNNFSFVNNNGTDRNSLDDHYELRRNNQNNSHYLLGRWQQGNTDLLFLHQDYVTGITNNSNTAQQARWQTIGDKFALRYATHQGGTLETLINRQYQFYTDPLSEIGLNKDDFVYDYLQRKIGWQGDALQINNSRLYYSLHHNRDEIRSDDQNAQRITRYNRTQWDLGLHLDINDYAALDARQELTRDQRDYTTSALAANVQLPLTFITFGAQAGLLERAPTLAELYVTQPQLNANADLNKETMAFIGASATTIFANNEIKLNIFQREFRDIIVVLYDSRGIGKSTNFQSAQVNGTEITASHHWQHVNISLQHTQLNTLNKTDNAALNGKKLPGFYHQSSDISADFHWHNIRYNLNYNLQDELYFDSANLVQARSKPLWNSAVYYASAGQQISLQLYNLLNESYQTFKNQPAPGRYGIITYNLKF